LIFPAGFAEDIETILMDDFEDLVIVHLADPLLDSLPAYRAEGELLDKRLAA
jgi:hypothetical protein